MDHPKNWISKRFELSNAKVVEATQPRDASEAAPQDASVVPGAPPSEPGDAQTFIEQGAEFEGTLRLRDSFRIDSEFRGEIVSEGRVVVASSAGIEANVCAREVVIAGAIVGDVKAGRQVIIRAGGRLHGNIETPCLEVEKGAFFNGRTSMTRPERVARAAAAEREQPESSAEANASAPSAPSSP